MSSRRWRVTTDTPDCPGAASSHRRWAASPPTNATGGLARQVVAGFGAHEAWTPSLLAPDVHLRVGMEGGVRVTNPLTPDESVLRQSLLPGMLGALAFNADRRQGDVRLFEVGHVFPPPDPARVARALARQGDTVIAEREVLGVALAADGDDARSAASLWLVLADAFGIQDVEMTALDGLAEPGPGSGAAGLHPTRSARLVRADGGGDTARPIGVVGEVDPDVLDEFGLDAKRRRVGWLEIDLEVLLDDAARRSSLVRTVSRFPSSDVDLAFVVDDTVPAAAVYRTLRQAGGELVESLTLFDVYRSETTSESARSLAYRLRFCAPDRTLTDDEVAQLRARCIAAVEHAHGAQLRG